MGVMMRRSAWRWLDGAGALAAAGVLACGQGAASAAPTAPARAAAPSKAAAYVPPGKPLYYGQTGAAVRSVQRRLNQLHYYAGPNDGVYGYDLLEAAYAFREVQGLPMNAVSGAEPITRAFERDLAHPRQYTALVPRGGRGRIEVDQSIQVLVLYKNDKPHLIIHISSGGGYSFCNPGGGCGNVAITPDGNYTALSFLPGDIQVPLGFMYNPVFFIGRAYAIHGGDAVPWYPTSHGCVRIPTDFENWFHNEVHVGGRSATHIYVRGTAPYL
jgi:L,D-transpeptidase catalytic domain/Putative peptidoglycan binding domain